MKPLVRKPTHYLSALTTSCMLRWQRPTLLPAWGRGSAFCLPRCLQHDFDLVLRALVCQVEADKQSRLGRCRTCPGVSSWVLNSGYIKACSLISPCLWLSKEPVTVVHRTCRCCWPTANTSVRTEKLLYFSICSQ